MSAVGRPRKPEGEKTSRNGPSYPEVTVKHDGVERGPDLPMNIGIRWSTRTLQWWDLWRNSAQAMFMLDTDWEIMLETALLHNEYWTPRKILNPIKGGKPKYLTVPKSPAELKALAGEMRVRLSAFGASHEDRQRRGMKILTDADQDTIQGKIAAAADEMVDYLDILNKEVAKKQNLT